jgi:hypothetical protein
MPFAPRILFIGIVCTSLSAAGAVRAAFAQETQPPLQLRVRPSGQEAAAQEALDRQQRLLKRMEQADYSVRSICSQCGDAWKHQTYAPFNPLSSLNPSVAAPEEQP